MIGPVRNRPPVADLTATFPPRNRDRNRRLVDIQPDGTCYPASGLSPRLAVSPRGDGLIGRQVRPAQIQMLREGSIGRHPVGSRVVGCNQVPETI